MKILVVDRMTLEMSEAGKRGWRSLARDLGLVIEKLGVFTVSVEIGVSEPRSEIVLQQTADGVAVLWMD